MQPNPEAHSETGKTGQPDMKLRLTINDENSRFSTIKASIFRAGLRFFDSFRCSCKSHSAVVVNTIDVLKTYLYSRWWFEVGLFL